MKNYQILIGNLLIAISIIITGVIIANSIENGFELLRSAISYLSELSQ